MNLTELQRKLVAAARGDTPSDRVPYGFEKRIMAHLGSRPVLDYGALWASGLWRALAPCLAIMLLLSAWSFVQGTATAPTNDLTQEFENTVLAAVDQDQPVDSTW